MNVDLSDFRLAVCCVVSAVPAGRVVTYGQVARLVGWPNHARLVGRVLGSLPSGSGIPCHRVVSASGRTAPGWPAQVALLKAEGVAFRPNGCVDMKRFCWDVCSVADD